MGIAAELGYRIEPPNAFQRLMQGLGATRSVSWLFARTLRHADDVVTRLTGGRQSVPQLMTGLPVVDLLTRGRRSGLVRRTHLIAIPLDDALAVVGTNFGQRATPAWVLNLEADPHATASYRGRSVAVRARVATDTEQAEVWAASAGVYGGYNRYRERTLGRRRVRVFVLEEQRH
jgi:deazaflavin-dependent oxidoreductase (nitroreductase family)